MTLDKVKKTNSFTWGAPIKLIEIGPYTLLKFHPWKQDGNTIITGTPDMDKISYHGWVDGKDTTTTWSSLELALAGVMGIKWAGYNNGEVEYYFCKMIDAPPFNKEAK